MNIFRARSHWIVAPIVGPLQSQDATAYRHKHLCPEGDTTPRLCIIRTCRYALRALITVLCLISKLK